MLLFPQVDFHPNFIFELVEGLLGDDSRCRDKFFDFEANELDNLSALRAIILLFDSCSLVLSW